MHLGEEYCNLSVGFRDLELYKVGCTSSKAWRRLRYSVSSLPQSRETPLLIQHYMGNKVGTSLSQEKKMTYCFLVVFTATQKVLKMKRSDYKVFYSGLCKRGKNRTQLIQTKH